MKRLVQITLENQIVATVGSPGAGKTSFCEIHFSPDEVLSPETIRRYFLSEEDTITQSRVSNRILLEALEQRVRLGFRSVVDRTNLGDSQIEELKKLASRYSIPLIFIGFPRPVEQIEQVDISWRGPAKIFGFFKSRQYLMDEKFFDGHPYHLAPECKFQVVKKPSPLGVYYNPRFFRLRVHWDLGTLSFDNTDDSTFHLFFPSLQKNLWELGSEELNLIFEAIRQGKGMYLCNFDELKELNLGNVDDPRVRTILRLGHTHWSDSTHFFSRYPTSAMMLCSKEPVSLLEPSFEIDSVFKSKLQSQKEIKYFVRGSSGDFTNIEPKRETDIYL